MKILVCGDLHTKVHILDKVAEKVKDYDRIIFLGDYVDEWNKPPKASFEMLNRVLRLKKQFPTKIILLCGNHDLSEWIGQNFRCSGWNPNTSFFTNELYSRNQELFCVAHTEASILFTHAGVESNWAKENKLKADGENIAKELAHELNEAFLFRGYDSRHNHLFNALSTAGPMRGGWHSPSPLWADTTELIASPYPRLTQVVGHTPVKTVQKHEFRNGDGTTNELWFCDTHSLYPDGSNIGDNSFLEITVASDNKLSFEKVNLL